MNEVAFPYEYGSDLHWFWGWHQRLDDMLSAQERVSQYDCWFFQPDRLAHNALLRFSIKYPVIASEVARYLVFTDRMFDKYLKHPTDTAEDNVAEAMFSLARVLKTAVDAIGEAEGRAVESAKASEKQPKVTALEAADELRKIKASGARWQSYRKHSGAIGASLDTLHNAVNSDPELVAWATAGQAARLRTTIPQHLQGEHWDRIDPADSGLDDEKAEQALATLLSESDEGDKKKILAMPASERMRLGRAFQSQLDDRD